MADAAAGPERRGVVAGAAGVGAAHAVAVAPRVDEARVAVPHRVGAEPEALERAGPEAGEQDVGPFEQAVEDLLPALGPHVERPPSACPRLASATDRLTPPLSVPMPCVASPR